MSGGRGVQWGCVQGVCVGGVSSGECIPACNGADILPPPWTEFLTHACKNITFSQLLLRTVTNSDL